MTQIKSKNLVHFNGLKLLTLGLNPRRMVKPNSQAMSRLKLTPMCNAMPLLPYSRRGVKAKIQNLKFKMVFRRIFLFPLLLLVTACNPPETTKLEKLSVGVVAYDESDRSLERYASLKKHLETQLKSMVEIEPAYNEVNALQEIQRRS
jgi:hypothetical protein